MLAALMLAACGGEAAQERVIPAMTHVEAPVQQPAPELSVEAKEMQARILEVTGRDSLRRFARLTDEAPDFVSNFEGSDHFAHWSLLRRTGVDPLRQIEALFADRHGVRTVGSEVWYIWPHFAAMPREDLAPDQLDFQDKAKLFEQIGEDGLAHIRAGGAYPGVRTAISKSGRWVYYLHDSGEDEIIIK